MQLHHIFIRYACLLLYRPIPLFSHEMEFWEHYGYRGNSVKLNVTECVNFPSEMAGKASSINTTNNCASFHSDWNCTGESVEILGHSPHHDWLHTWDFNDKAYSVGPCLDSCDILITGPQPTSPFKVTAFSENNFKGSYIPIYVDGCTPVPNVLPEILSIQTNGQCVQLWANSNCTSKFKPGEYIQDTVELRVNSPKHNELGEWQFPNIMAVSHCSWKCDRGQTGSEQVEAPAEVVNDNELQIFHKVNFRGKMDVISVNEDCTNLGFQSEGKAMSVKTKWSVCLTLFDRRDCEGRSMDVSGSKGSLQDEGFEQVTRSVKYCEVKSYRLSITDVSIIIGILVGVIVLCCAVSVYIVRRIKRVISLSDREVEEFLEGVYAPMEINEVNSESYVKYESDNHSYNSDFQVSALSLVYDRNFEINRKQFSIGATLGAGNFGIVYKATLYTDQNEKKIVAVKTMKRSSTATELRCLMKEVKVMLYIADLGTHPNVANLVGCCTELLKTTGDLYMIMEYYSNGSLLSYLRATRNKVVQTGSGGLHPYQQLKWMEDIACGMTFLSASNIVHRDLSTRNILLDDDLNAKICDFGLSRRLYENTSYLRKGRDPLAWQWLSIEAILHSTFTEKSDVWSFGVVCWELFTFGEEPFAGEKWGKDFIDNLKLGYRLPRPKDCSNGCYQLMLQCWQKKASNRPEFSKIMEHVSYMKTNPGIADIATLSISTSNRLEGYVESFVDYV